MGMKCVFYEPGSKFLLADNRFGSDGLQHAKLTDNVTPAFQKKQFY
jgi:hypothetical protein